MSDGWPRLLPYPEWRPRYGEPWSVEHAIELMEIPNDETGAIDVEPTGRIRIVVEGNRELVNELVPELKANIARLAGRPS